MMLETNIELLGCVPIFQGLTQDQLSAIANKGRKTYVSEGATIVRAGDKGDTAYLILTGLAITDPQDGSGLIADTLDPGTLVGELAMLVETTHTLTVKAKARVRALALERADLYQVMEADPSIAHHFAEKLVDRLIMLGSELRQVDTQFAALELSLDHRIAMAG